jgi:DNA polymerase I-like protein with 3'-5' exonuclease and polymerase domains
MSQHLISSLSDMKACIKDLIKVPRKAHDTETKGPDDKPDISGLYPFHGARAFSHIFATEHDEFYFNFNGAGGINPKYKADLQELFEDPKALWFYVNAIFDNTIMHFDGLKNKGRIVDVPSIARIEFNNHGKIPGLEETFLSLDYLAKYYEVPTLKDDRVKAYIKEHDLYSAVRCRFTNERIPRYDLVPLDVIVPYGCADGRATYDTGQTVIKCINLKDEMYEHQRKFPGKMIDVAANEIKVTSSLIEMKITGFEIDRTYIENAIAHENAKLEKLTSEVKSLVGDDVNLNSGAQIAKLLASKGIELPRKEVTDTALKRAATWAQKAELAKAAGKLKQYKEAIDKAREYSQGNSATDKKTLAKILEKHPDLDFLSKVTKAKETEKKIGTYYKNFLLLADELAVIHCTLSQEAAKTGRLSSSGPNLQNLHKEEWKDDSGNIINEYLIRKSFVNTDPDYDLFFFDYEQQEMIVMLDQAGEMAVINKLKSKEFKDFYLATMAVLEEITGKKITRKQAKAIALGLAYGEGIAKLAGGLNMTEDEARKFKDEFFRALPALKRLQKSLENQVKFYGKIHNPFGRVSYIDKDFGYKALNSFVQGTCADITKKAMVDIDVFLKENNLLSKMILQVHDEIIMKLHKTERWIIPEIRRIMAAAYPHIHIPLSVGVDYSATSWGEKSEWAA